MQFVQNALKILSIHRTMSFYAVACGHKVGIYDSWKKCEEQVKGFKGAKYKKFPSFAEAELFIKEARGVSDGKRIMFSPANFAVALGNKNAFDWKKHEPNSNSSQTNEKDIPNEYWPESDGDTFDETTITDAELLAAMTATEEKPPSPAPATSSNNLKRKLSDTKTSESSSKIPKHASKIWEPAGTINLAAYDFQIDVEGFVIVYTDGSCINNGRANATAGFGVYFGDAHPLNTAKPVLGRVTNNAGEIQAAIHAIKVAKDVGIKKLCISTDSQFLINAVTAWIGAWKRNNWRLKTGEPVKNIVDFMKLDSLLQRDDNLVVKWNYVKAHKGIKGNEMADKLAREGSDIYKRLHSNS